MTKSVHHDQGNRVHDILTSINSHHQPDIHTHPARLEGQKQWYTVEQSQITIFIHVYRCLTVEHYFQRNQIINFITID